MKNVTETGKKWNTVKPFLSIKTKKQGKIMLVEKDEIVSDDKNLSKIFNFDQSGTVVSACPLISAIANYENHPSVTKIRNKQASSVSFSFSLVEEKEIEKIL